MANQDQNTLPSPHFLRVILSEDHARLKLAPKFLERFGNTLSKQAFLKAVGSPLTWEMETVRSREGRVWLRRGWKEFAEHYSIKFGHMLMFEYEGDSKFSVSMFGLDTMEIQYPVEDARNDHNKGKSKVGEKEQEEIDDEGDYDDDDDDSDSDSDYEHKTLPSKKMSPSEGSSKEVKGKNRNVPPCFRVRMQNKHVTAHSHTPSLLIPQAHADEYFLGQANSLIYLRTKEDGGVSGGLFECKYHIGRPPQLRRRLSLPYWRRFMYANRLQVDDICIFELVKPAGMLYEVTILRAKEGQD